MQEMEEALLPLRESFLFRSRLIASSVNREHRFQGQPVVLRHEERIESRGDRSEAAKK